jgi:hypothetical protein
MHLSEQVRQKKRAKSLGAVGYDTIDGRRERGGGVTRSRCPRASPGSSIIRQGPFRSHGTMV